MLVGEEHFEVLGVALLEGRSLSADGGEEVLISERLWDRRFQRSRSVLGQPLELDGQAHTVIGVMPKAAQLSHGVDLWHRLPAAWQTGDVPLYIVGWLREGVTLDDVRSEVAVLGYGHARVNALPPPVRRR